MASDAYLNALKEIPKEIQDDVIRSINIADEIYKVLQKQGKTSADLARKMKKSESEISRWMAGLHNFTFKTVEKIEEALGEKLIYTKSFAESQAKEERDQLKRTIAALRKKIRDVKQEKDLTTGFDTLLVFSCSSKPTNLENNLVCKTGEFMPDSIDNIRLQPNSAAKT